MCDTLLPLPVCDPTAWRSGLVRHAAAGVHTPHPPVCHLSRRSGLVQHADAAAATTCETLNPEPACADTGVRRCKYGRAVGGVTSRDHR
eukprot:350134-Chlamydomonas_euryale.AAC.3